MLMLCEEEKELKLGARIKVIGIGGAGGNAVNSMIESEELPSVEFIIANTDAQALENSLCSAKIQLGTKITKGLGAGANPDIGRRAAEEDYEAIAEQIKQADILFLACGLGGGTGSGALPVVANVAREMGILTVAVVTRPFSFEGRRRATIAEEAVTQLRKSVDTVLIVPNQRLIELSDAKISMLNAFALSNDVLKQAIKGIADIISKPGHINVDFADVKTIMKNMGMALMGTGRARGENRGAEAARKAISSPLLENLSIAGAKGVLINITGNTDLGLYEINEAASLIYDLVNPDANIILGSVIDPTINDEIMVTVIATGFEEQHKAVDASLYHPKNTLKPSAYIPAAKKIDPIEQTEQVILKSQDTTEEQMLEENKIDHNDLDTPAYLRKQSMNLSSQEQREE